jgi:hypothetical protein
MKGALVVYLLLVWALLEGTRNVHYCHYILFVFGMGISRLHGFLAILPTSGSPLLVFYLMYDHKEHLRCNPECW